MKRVAAIVSIVLCCAFCGAQEVEETIVQQVGMDSLSAGMARVKEMMKADSVRVREMTVKDSVAVREMAVKDSVAVKPKDKSVPLYANFKPDANIATWLALAIPGAGQIYNRKYWKLPIVYGIGVGIGYAIGYTNRNYQDYRNAYQSYNSSQPNPDLYKPMIPAGYPESSYSNYFKTQMDKFRRSRDISIVAAVIAYALQVIDAFVDAQLCDFDVSPDLSIDVAPEVQKVNDQQAVGVGAKVNF